MTRLPTFLFIAGLLEVGWAIGLKYTEGFTKLGPSIATLVCMIVSIVLLATALKTIPVAAAQLSGATLFSIPYGPLAAATSLGTFPLIVLVLIFQRKIVQGLTSGAVKG